MQEKFTNEMFMLKALSLAKKAALEDEVPVGAVVVYKNRIISCGQNRREYGKNALFHAELEAIYKACKYLNRWRLFDCDLYVTLEPCPMCAGAIINSRIDRVYFGAYDKKAGACGTMINLFDKGLNHNPEIIGGVLENECAKELSDFFLKLRLRLKNKKREAEV